MDPVPPGRDRPPAEGGNGDLRAHGLLAKLSWALCSESGAVREHNEDFAGVYAPTTPDDSWDRGPLFLVCDGLGGHAGGEVASRTAVGAALSAWTAPDPAPAPVAMRRAVRAANTAVLDASLELRRPAMASTLTALSLAGREALVAHVGDSRCYLVRGGSCQQLTADHSRVGEMLRRGLLSQEKADAHPGRSQLLRVIGTEPLVQVDLVRRETEAGDVFVLCSDGLWEPVRPPRIAELIGAIGTAAVPTVVEAAERLVEQAMRAGAPDNVTVLVVKVTTDRAVPAVGVRRALFRRDRRWHALLPTR